MDAPTRDALARLERLSAVGRAAASFAHEIRGPLHVIASTAELSLEHMSPNLELRAGLEVILRNARQAGQAAQALLDFSMPSAARGGPCDLPRLLEAQLRLLDKLLVKQGIRLEARLDPAGTPAVDEKALEVVLHHLLVNALEAMPRGGVLTAALERAEGAVLVRVIDTGVGMAPETLNRVGTPFFTTKEHGTGLGIYLAQRLLKDWGGDLSLSSAPGRGTTALVRLPAP